MPRESISLTEENDLWLQNHIKQVGDYPNKSELVNDLIKRTRKAEIINKKVIIEDLCEYCEQSPQEILDEFKLLLLQVNTSKLN
jgi:antitoxin ParD1/3/4